MQCIPELECVKHWTKFLRSAMAFSIKTQNTHTGTHSHTPLFFVFKERIISLHIFIYTFLQSRLRIRRYAIAQHQCNRGPKVIWPQECSYLCKDKDLLTLVWMQTESLVFFLRARLLCGWAMWQWAWVTEGWFTTTPQTKCCGGGCLWVSMCVCTHVTKRGIVLGWGLRKTHECVVKRGCLISSQGMWTPDQKATNPLFCPLTSSWFAHLTWEQSWANTGVQH